MNYIFLQVLSNYNWKQLISNCSNVCFRPSTGVSIELHRWLINRYTANATYLFRIFYAISSVIHIVCSFCVFSDQACNSFDFVKRRIFLAFTGEYSINFSPTFVREHFLLKISTWESLPVYANLLIYRTRTIRNLLGTPLNMLLTVHLQFCFIVLFTHGLELKSTILLAIVTSACSLVVDFWRKI